MGDAIFHPESGGARGLAPPRAEEFRAFGPGDEEPSPAPGDQTPDRANGP